MATTTLLPFNPTQTNQESDAAYLADSNRTGGFGTDAIWPSPLANKTLNQMSNYLYAFFTSFANKGFTTNDDDISLLIAQCANFLTTADIQPDLVSVAYSPTPVFNAGAANGFQMTLSGNVTSSSFSGLIAPGQIYRFVFVQDGTGGRTVVWPSNVIGGQQPNPVANSETAFLFVADLAGNLYPPNALRGGTANVTGSRGFNTAYQNTTGTMLFVSVIARTNAPMSGFTFSWGLGATSGGISYSAGPSATQQSGGVVGTQLTFMVPAGMWYEVTYDFTPVLLNWFETPLV